MARPRANRRAIFLDRDGVLVSDLGHPTSPLLIAGAARAVADLNGGGWTIVVVTNQTAVARGVMTESDVDDFHVKLGNCVGAEGGTIERYYHCPHHPHSEIAQYRKYCDCRKPRPGLLLRAAEELGLDIGKSIMVGDRMSDVESGHRAGVRCTVLIESPMNSEPRIATDMPVLRIEPDARLSSLADAVPWILALPSSIPPYP